MTATLTAIDTGLSDGEFAKDAAARVRGKLAEVCAILDEAHARGMRIEFNCGIDGFGRNVVARLDVMKRMA